MNDTLSQAPNDFDYELKHEEDLQNRTEHDELLLNSPLTLDQIFVEMDQVDAEIQKQYDESYLNTPLEEEHSWGDILTDMSKQTVEGVKDGVNGVTGLPYDVAGASSESIYEGEWLGKVAGGLNNVFGTDFNTDAVTSEEVRNLVEDYKSKIQLPDIFGKAETTAGEITNSLAQFLAPMGALAKIDKARKLNVLGKVKSKGWNDFGRLTTQGAIVDFTAFDGAEEHLSNALVNVNGGDSMWNNVVTQYLAQDDSKSPLLNRITGAMEGVLLGATIDGAIGAGKVGKDVLKVFEDGVKSFHAFRTAARKRVEENRFVTYMAGEAPEEGAKFKNVKSSSKPKMGERTATYKRADGGMTMVDVGHIKDKHEAKALLEQVINNRDLKLRMEDGAKKSDLAQPIPNHVARRLAEESDVTVEAIKNGEYAQEFNDEFFLKLARATDLQGQMADSLSKMSQDFIALGRPLTKSEENAFRKEFMSNYYMREEVSLMYKAPARAMQYRGASDDLVHIRNIERAIQDFDSMTIKDTLNLLANGHEEIAMKGVKNNFWRAHDAMRELYSNFILSSPETLAIDTVGSLGMAGWNELDRAVASGIGKARQYMSDEPVTDRVVIAETGAVMRGWGQSMWDMMLFSAHELNAGQKAVREGWKDGDGLKEKTLNTLGSLKDVKDNFGEGMERLRINNTTRFDQERHNSSLKLTVNDDDAIITRATKNIANSSALLLARSPLGLMSAKDDLAKHAMWRAEMNALIMRKASAQEGLTGEALKKRVKELEALSEVQISNADGSHLNQFMEALNHAGASEDDRMALWAMNKKSAQVANELSFQDKESMFAEGVKKLVNAVPFAYTIMPFIKTIDRISARVAEHSLLAPATRAFWDGLAKGGASRDMVIARMTTGTSMMMLGGMLYADNKLTGNGSLDKGQREAMLRAGWRPNAILVGGKYVDIQKVQPFVFPLMLGAVMSETWREVGHVANFDEEMDNSTALWHIMHETGKMYMNNTFMTGMKRFYEAIASDNPERLQTWINDTTASHVMPNISAWYARQIDPYMREANTLGEKIMAKTTKSQQLAMKLNVFGEPIMRPNQNVSIAGVPFPLKNQVIAQDKDFQRMAEAGASLRLPDDKYKGVRLTDDEHHRLLEILGEEDVRGAIKEVMSTSAFKNLPRHGDERTMTQAKIIEKVHNKYKDRARKLLVRENLELRKRVKRRNEELRQHPSQTPSSANMVEGMNAYRGALDPLIDEGLDFLDEPLYE